MRRSTPIVLFGEFIQPPEDGGEPRRVSREGPGRTPSPGRAEPFDALVFTCDSMRNRRRCATLPCSVVLHAAAAAAVITVPLLVSADLPGPAGAVAAFFVDPIVAPPPPPPPPAAPAARAVAKKARVATPPPESTAHFIAPLEVPEDVRPEEGLDLGIEGGVPGGVAGGVPGGVVGAIVGGIPDLEEVAPPPMAPLRVGRLIKEPVKVKHVDPVYPDVAIAAHVEGIVIIEAVIDENGRVARARVLRGFPILEAAALDAVRQWEYTPTLLNGIPTPIVMTVTINFELFRPGR